MPNLLLYITLFPFVYSNVPPLKFMAHLMILKTHDRYLVVACKFPSNPDEWFLKVVIILGRDFEVLKILLSVECYLLCFDFSVFYFYFVSAKNDWNVLAYSGEISETPEEWN